MTIHSTAIVDPSAKIGQNVQIDAYAIIGPDTVIGDGCHIRSHAVVEFTELGKNCVIFPNACIGLAPQHLKYNGEKTKLIVGDNCQFREGTSVHRGTPFAHGVTKIGNNGYFMGYSHIAHDCEIGNNVIFANGVLLAGHVTIGDNVFISGVAAVHQHGRIGQGAIVSGGTMAVQDVAPFCIAQGDRAVLRGLNVIGMRRAGLKVENIKAIKAAYKAAFLSDLMLAEALATPELNVNDPYVKIFKDFLATPKRGFTRPPVGAVNIEAEGSIS